MSARFWRGSRILPFQEFPVSFSRSLSCLLPALQFNWNAHWNAAGSADILFILKEELNLFVQRGIFSGVQGISFRLNIPVLETFQLKGQNHVVGVFEKCKQYFGHSRLDTSFNNSHSALNLNKTNFSRLREMKRSWEILKEMPRELREAQTSQNPACTIRYSTGRYVWIL